MLCDATIAHQNYNRKCVLKNICEDSDSFLIAIAYSLWGKNVQSHQSSPKIERMRLGGCHLMYSLWSNRLASCCNLIFTILLYLNFFCLKEKRFCKLEFKISTPSIPKFKCSRHDNDYGSFTVPLLKLYNNSNKEAIEHFYSFVFDFLDGGDQTTQLVLNKNLKYVHTFIECKFRTGDLASNQTRKELWEQKEKIVKNLYPGLPMYLAEVFMHDHCITELPQKVKNYIRERDMLDIGAFKGDSMAAINKYTDRKVYGYEPNMDNFKALQNNIKRWNLNTSKLFYQCLGLGDVDTVKHSNSKGGSSNLDDNKNSVSGNKVEITTIDKEVKKHGIKIGFIKADTEGYAWKIFKGGMESIRKHRPVLSLQLYHSPEEYFNIAQAVRGLGNYIMQYRHDGMFPCDFTETTLLAYPAEIIYPQ